MGDVRSLNVYKTAFKLTIDIYRLTEHFPKSELFGLTSQMRRAVISINSNLSEGSHRNSTNEYKHFVGIAKGSASELLFQIEVSKELGYIDSIVANKLITDTKEVCKMLFGLTVSLDKKITTL